MFLIFCSNDGQFCADGGLPKQHNFIHSRILHIVCLFSTGFFSKPSISIVMTVLQDILPERMRAAFSRLPIERVYELRLRCNSPVVVTIASRSFFLCDTGFTQNVSHSLVTTRTDLETIIHKASDYSLYAVNEQLKQGFITIRGGVRIGICGELVIEKDYISTIKNISSLNIRIPHQIRGCTYNVLPYIFGNDRPLKTLVISPPGAGKTTFLRDLALQVSEKYLMPNILVLDERGEIAANYLGENQLDVGCFSDVMTAAPKSYGFENGIRSMRPDVVITDEIVTSADIDMIKLATKSGVCVFASVHASSIEEIRMKPYWREIIDEQIFDRYIVLTVKDTAGCVAGVFDKHLKLLAL